MKPQFNFVAVILAVLVLLSFSVVNTQQDKPWDVPAEAAKLKNPYPADKENLAVGKQLYTKHCKSCHGKEGLGDGPKADELDTFPGDLTESTFHAQTDGAMYYKLTEGRDEMPEFTKKIPSDEDRWLIVHYMRTLK